MSSSPLSAPESPLAFTLLAEPEGATDPRFDEALLGMAAAQGPVACIWQTAQGLVVPRTYRRFNTFEATCERFAAQGWPVTVRQTGGGIVPQGPGIVNLSLAYVVQGPPLRHSEPGYRLICRVLAEALSSLGVASFPAAVEGSFCDGRYNLAVSCGGEAVKIAGTAQMWRRLPDRPEHHAGLVHALVLVDVDGDAMTRLANEFEAALGSTRRYRSDRVVSVARLLGAAQPLQARLTNALAQSVENLQRT